VNLRIAQKLAIAVSIFLLITMGVTWGSNGVGSVKLKRASPVTKTPMQTNVLNVVLSKTPIVLKMQFVSDASSDVPPPTTTTTTSTTTTTIPPTTTTTTTAIASKPEVTTTIPPAAPSEEGNPVWTCIISHESGGNPTAVNSSSGAGGLFQFLPSSWIGYGGGKYASLPENASVSAQWDIAISAQRESGWYPWRGDGCTPVG